MGTDLGRKLVKVTTWQTQRFDRVLVRLTGISRISKQTHTAGNPMPLRFAQAGRLDLKKQGLRKGFRERKE